MARVLDYVARKRHRQVKVEAQSVINWLAIFVTNFLQTAEQINFFTGLTFFEQGGPWLNCSGLNSYETIEFKDMPKRVYKGLLNHPL
ncbi:hypothetical protein KIMH_08920 [Bombiscardovia apis]|uniref:Uncharacterized protein n=1 Tax=Bombiscardovia apis TaxID=2932182 RepID=A0ABM8BCY5_9BIFI|nr:hypothetical protein KIMH_08920 [Bombiscardovia apis]